MYSFARLVCVYRNVTREGEEIEKKKEEKQRRRNIYIYIHKYTRTHDSFPPFDSSIFVYILVSH